MTFTDFALLLCVPAVVVLALVVDVAALIGWLRRSRRRQ
jgi:hypothetical protein